MLVKLLKTSELCDVLGVSRQCVYKWRNQDNPLPTAVNNTESGGKLIRYKLEDVMEWLNSNGKEEKAQVLRTEED
jgi:predicted DNA-binding transcriptional regulator AlpA